MDGSNSNGWRRNIRTTLFQDRTHHESMNPADISSNDSNMTFNMMRLNQTLPNAFADHSFVMNQSLLDESMNQIRQDVDNSINTFYSKEELEQMDDELRERVLKAKRKADAYKTAMCDSYREDRPCEYGEHCSFAHSTEELRLPQPKGRLHPKYKTVLCDKFSKTGFCKYGGRCQFVHKIKNPVLQEQRRLVGKKDDENLRPIDSLGLSARQRLVHANPELAEVDKLSSIINSGRQWNPLPPPPTRAPTPVKSNLKPIGEEVKSARRAVFQPAFPPIEVLDLNTSLPTTSSLSASQAEVNLRHLLMNHRGEYAAEMSGSADIKYPRDPKRRSFFPSIGREFQRFYQ